MKALKLFQHYSILIRPQRVLWEMGRISPLNILKALSKWSSKHYCRHGDWATKGDCCLAQVTHTDSWQSRTRTPILLCLHYPPYIPFHIYPPPPPEPRTLLSFTIVPLDNHRGSTPQESLLRFFQYPASLLMEPSPIKN